MHDDDDVTPFTTADVLRVLARLFLGLVVVCCVIHLIALKFVSGSYLELQLGALTSGFLGVVATGMLLLLKR